jgi:hypothetical protein
MERVPPTATPARALDEDRAGDVKRSGREESDAPLQNAVGNQTMLRSMGVVMRKPAEDAVPATPAPGGPTMLIIPPERLKAPGPDDLIVLIHAGKILALPAEGNFVQILPLPKGIEPTEPLFTVPTVGKESLALVNAGGRVGFQIDAGGGPGVLSAPAVAEAQRVLGVTAISGVVASHIHEDHVNGLVNLVRTQQIRPENIYVPAAFLVPSAKGNTVTQAFIQMQSDPALRALGHGPQARYATIATPTADAFIQTTVDKGELRIEMFGLTSAFQQLEQQRQSNRQQSVADRASLVTRVEHLKTGERTLYVSDPRGNDLALLRQAMGDGRYNEMLRGVRTIHNFQHHMGALEKEADRTGLVDLITRTYLQSGQLTVVAQSQETYGGRQFLNRSMIKALTDIGIDVHIAGTPQGGRIGTLTMEPNGVAVPRGPGIESFSGNAEMQSHVRRLMRLTEAEGTLQKYEEFLRPEFRYSGSVSQARAELEGALRDYVSASMGGVRTGESGRGQPSLSSSGVAAQTAALLRVRAERPIEDKLLPSYMEALRDLERTGETRKLLKTEMEAARRTGRLSDRGIEALWEVEPDVARQLLRTSSLPRAEQRRVSQQLPGAGVSGGPRAVATFMLALEIFNEVAPLIRQAQVDAEEKNVGTALHDIFWWQSANLHPNTKGVASYWFSTDPEPSTDKKQIQAWIDKEELSYLVIENIDDSEWMAFMLWASANVRNFVDWNRLIDKNSSIKGEGKHIDEQKWQYRVGTIKGATIGWDVEFAWRDSPQLTLTLNAIAEAVVERSEKEIGTVATQNAPISQDTISAPGSYLPKPLFEDKPKAIGRKRFRKDIKDPALYTLYNQRRITGYSADEEFFVFPKSIVRDEIPEEYLLVGGASYNTYVHIFNSPNRYTESDSNEFGQRYTYVTSPRENRRELMAALAADLVDVT